MKLVRRMLAGFQNLSAHDAEGYRIALIEVMSDYPIWAGEQAVLKAAEQNPDFPLTAPRLRIWLAELVRPHRFVEEWNARSQKQIAERLPEHASTAEPVSGGGKVFSNFDDAVAAHGRPIGPFEAGRQCPYRGGSK
jgi:hypothetical protein